MPPMRFDDAVILIEKLILEFINNDNYTRHPIHRIFTNDKIYLKCIIPDVGQLLPEPVVEPSDHLNDEL